MKNRLGSVREAFMNTVTQSHERTNSMPQGKKKEYPRMGRERTRHRHDGEAGFQRTITNECRHTGSRVVPEKPRAQEKEKLCGHANEAGEFKCNGNPRVRHGKNISNRKVVSIDRQNDFLSQNYSPKQTPTFRTCPKLTKQGQLKGISPAENSTNSRNCFKNESSGAVLKCKRNNRNNPSCKNVFNGRGENRNASLLLEDIEDDRSDLASQKSAAAARPTPQNLQKQVQSGLTMKDLETNQPNIDTNEIIGPSAKHEKETDPGVVEIKTLDAATNTDAAFKPRPNTAIVTLVSRQDESIKNSDNGGRLHSGRLIQVQHLPKMNIRPQLTKQLGASINIATAVEEFANREKNNVALFNLVHGTGSAYESEKIYYANDGSGKEETGEVARSLGDSKSSLGSCSLCRNCSKCDEEQMTGAGKHLHDAAVSLSEKLNSDQNRDAGSLKEALDSLVRSVHDMYALQIRQLRELSNGDSFGPQISSKMNLVAELLAEEIEKEGRNGDDHYPRLNNIIRHLISDIKSTNICSTEQRKDEPLNHPASPLNHPASPLNHPASSKMHTESSSVKRPSTYNCHHPKSNVNPRAPHQLKEFGINRCRTNHAKNNEESIDEMKSKISNGESYAKHSIKIPESQCISYRELTPGGSQTVKKSELSNAISDLKLKRIETVCDINYHLKSMTLGARGQNTHIQKNYEKDNVVSNKLNETFIVPVDGAEIEVNSQPLLQATNKDGGQVTTKERRDSDYEDDWEPDEDFIVSEDNSYSTKNEGFSSSKKNSINSIEDEQKLKPSVESISVSVEQQKTEENVREYSGSLLQSNQSSVLKDKNDKRSIHVGNTDWVRYSKKLDAFSHSDVLGSYKNSEKITGSYYLNSLSQDIEYSSTMRNISSSNNLSNNGKDGQIFQLENFNKIIDEIKSNCLNENKIIEYVNERIDDCLNKRINNRPNLTSEIHKINDVISEKLEASKDSKTKFEIRLPKLLNEFDGVVSIHNTDNKNEIKLSLIVPEGNCESLIVNHEKQFIEKMPQLVHCSVQVGNEDGEEINDKCSRNTMAENINQDTLNKAEVESKSIESVTTNILKDIVEEKVNNVFKKYESRIPVCHHVCCNSSKELSLLPSSNFPHSLDNMHRKEEHVVKSMCNEHNKENIPLVSKLANETLISNTEQLKNQETKGLKCLIIPCVSLSVPESSEVQSNYSIDKLRGDCIVNVSNNMLTCVNSDTKCEDVTGEKPSKPMNEKKNSAELKCDLTLSCPTDSGERINSGASLQNFHLCNESNALLYQNSLGLRNSVETKSNAAGKSFVKITSSFDILPQKKSYNDVGIMVEENANQFQDNCSVRKILDSSADLATGVNIQRLFPVPSENYMVSDKCTPYLSIRSDCDETEYKSSTIQFGQGIKQNVHDIDNIKKLEHITEVNLEVKELSSVESSENSPVIGVPYYDTDNMSDGEVGFASTSNSYSSGEIKPRIINQSETTNDSSSSSLNVDYLGTVKLMKSGRTYEDATKLLSTGKIIGSKEIAKNFTQNLTNGEASCSDFEIHTESGSDSDAGLNVTHLMKLLHDCKTSLSDLSNQSSTSQDLSVAETSPVK